MARKDIFAGLETEPTKRAAKTPIYHGAARSLVDSIEELASRAGSTIEVDPNLVDPSPFPDRLPDDDPQSFEEFKKSVSEDGQQVPIQIRAHPTAAGRYQVVYGHRRLRAAKELGRPVKAIRVDLSDAELVIAQGIENGARQDLSWIEKALFAKRMEDAGTKPRDIKAALVVDDTEMAKMRSVNRVVPETVVMAIGRAPKVGRPRWTELAKLMQDNAQAAATIEKTLAAAKVSDSGQRFQIAMQALKAKPAPKVELTLKISATTSRGKAFAKFVESRLPALMEEFKKGET